MDKKVLVAYFSASGTTEQAAKKLSEVMNADLYEIKPVKPYSGNDLNWNDKQSRSSLEMSNQSFRPEIEDDNINLDNYDEILLGFPVWWYVAPTVINTFIERHGFENKTVVPFATSGGSGIENCEKQLYEQYPNIKWKKGLLVNTVKDTEILAESLK